MYYPKSQIQTNLYSNAELSVLATGQVYIGDYWKTSDGKFFAGKTPSSPNAHIELTISSTKAISFPQAEPPTEDGSTYVEASMMNIEYAKLKNLDISKYPKVPKFQPASPTEEDYKSGEFTRFFCKKNNESFYIEISQNDYIKLTEKNSEYLHQLYSPFTLNWVLEGSHEDIARENENEVRYKETVENLYGLGAYLKNNYLQFTDLTPGVKTFPNKRVYFDSGEVISSNLPKAYQLGNQPKSKGQNCANCIFYQSGLCKKWNANIRNEYWCAAWKRNPGVSLNNASQTSLQNQPVSSNIYTQPTNNSGGGSYSY